MSIVLIIFWFDVLAAFICAATKRFFLCSAKTGPQKKMSQKDIFAQNRALNAARRKRGNTRG